ncbi:cytosol aminopeptidase family, catalytic domain-domain-containing protein [Syncephalastrum racemosum]|uniref:Cytosol aminopeptidase family, catalytic domain-domain-containing protein n=1 Tax=Syncephalastrum racemosum TaxID=13706 RepID=A0A1X2H474_SYNRA|nr:cytosol aminopeptidase family, catalytic domain-domain-containing protein [Syncephalastrum racemosum]
MVRMLFAGSPNLFVARHCVRTQLNRAYVRHFSNPQKYDGLVLGAYTDHSKVTLAGTRGVSDATQSSLLQQLEVSNFKKAGDVRVLYNLGGVQQVAVVSLGEQPKSPSEAVQLEAARRATSLGIHALKKQGVKNVGVDVSVSPQGAAEGAVLAQFSFDKLKNAKDRSPEIQVGPFGEASTEWEHGEIYGTSQNLARMLMTTPGNLMTPKLFSEEVAYLLAGLENTEVIVRDEEWAARQKMNAFMAVAKGSKEPLRFLEIHYRGADEGKKPHGLVGKGVTFDSGGISIKPSNNMALMKGDMGGAATVVGALYGISKLALPVNVVACVPLCENMPDGGATKPGDVVRGMNGKSIEVVDTDAEGRLILADALYYLSSKFEPKSLIDLATLTGAMDVALGNVFAGVFTNSDVMWQQLESAGKQVSDPFWRMPLHDGYLKEMKESQVADLNNLGKGRSGGACSAAAFLKEFVAEQAEAWAHIDIAGVMDSQGTDGYHIKGMSGRPTRSLIEYLKQAV